MVWSIVRNVEGRCLAPGHVLHSGQQEKEARFNVTPLRKCLGELRGMLRNVHGRFQVHEWVENTDSLCGCCVFTVWLLLELNLHSKVRPKVQCPSVKYDGRVSLREHYFFIFFICAGGRVCAFLTMLLDFLFVALFYFY